MGNTKKTKKTNELSLYEYKEKKQAKKTKPQIPLEQKHDIVTVAEFEGEYNYDKRRKEWHKRAGHNAEQLVCGKCRDDDNWETILLDDGRHICYYCWIKKPDGLKTKKAASKSTSTKKVKSTTKSTVKKSVDSKKASLALYENYDPYNRAELWDKYVTKSSKYVTCDICESSSNDEYVALTNGDNVCYYCWFKEPSKKALKQKTNKNKQQKQQDVVIASSDDKEEGPGKLFWVVTIISGLLLIALLVILSVGIITDWFTK